MFTTEDEWKAAVGAVKDELATEYAQGRIDVQQPVDKNLTDLSLRITRRVILSTTTV